MGHCNLPMLKGQLMDTRHSSQPCTLLKHDLQAAKRAKCIEGKVGGGGVRGRGGRGGEGDLHAAVGEDEGDAPLGHQLGVESPNFVFHQVHEGCPLAGHAAAARQDRQRTAAQQPPSHHIGKQALKLWHFACCIAHDSRRTCIWLS